MPVAPDGAVVLAIAEKHLALIAAYNPYRNFQGVKDRAEFSKLISNDPAFTAFGFDDDRYAMARIGGNLITSLHRKIGDMYEDVFGYLLQCRFDLSADDLVFSVDVPIGNRIQQRSTDGLIPRDVLRRSNLPMLPRDWKKGDGLAFEVRSCYQIGDSKRIQADWDMALALKAQKIIPVMLVFCSTSLKSPVLRLRQSWCLFEGQQTFEFIAALTGFDLYGFMQENRDHFRKPIMAAFARL